MATAAAICLYQTAVRNDQPLSRPLATWVIWTSLPA